MKSEDESNIEETLEIMKKTALRFAFVLLAGLVATPALSHADTGPAKTVENIIAAIKSAGNASGVVDFVNWKKAYEQLPDVQRSQLQIDSPDKMKAFFKEMLTSPAATMKKQMEAKLATVPADKQEVAKQSVQKIEKMMQEKEIEMKDRIAKTEYKVSDEKISGETATVKLTQVYNGETKTEEIKLEKDGDKWLLPALNSLNGGQQAGPPPSAGAHPGAAPGAPAVPPAAAPAGH